MPIARNQILITLDGVKDLQKREVACIYLREGEPEAILVSTRITPLGPEARYFNIWPGLFKHHLEFGDGRDLRFGADYNITLEGNG